MVHTGQAFVSSNPAAASTRLLFLSDKISFTIFRIWSRFWDTSGNFRNFFDTYIFSQEWASTFYWGILLKLYLPNNDLSGLFHHLFLIYDDSLLRNSEKVYIKPAFSLFVVMYLNLTTYNPVSTFLIYVTLSLGDNFTDLFHLN